MNSLWGIASTMNNNLIRMKWYKSMLLVLDEAINETTPERHSGQLQLTGQYCYGWQNESRLPPGGLQCSLCVLISVVSDSLWPYGL